MPYTYSKVDELVTSPPTKNVGTGQCVPLVQKYSTAPTATLWRAGDAVRGTQILAKGTAIATFKNGVYANNRHGNHAAFYLSQDLTGIWVVDQYSGSSGIRKRHLRFKGKNAKGEFIDPSNNGDAFSVIQ